MRPEAQTLLGRYRLGEIVGAGGMGTVVRAHDEILGREVAVKLLREELAYDERSLARFRQEARIAASLSHPGIAAVYDFAEEEGRPAIVMELLDGRDLHSILEQEGPMDPAAVAGILAQAADALAYAHGMGAVHRDIKPANIFLTTGGVVKVTDFGVAYAASAGGGQLTTTGTLIGTPDYLSPEQVRGQRATAASDIYSLGCVAFQLVCARPPFGGDNSIATATARLGAPAPSARVVNAEVSPELDAVIRRALAPEPDQRFPSAAAMARALRGAARAHDRTPPMVAPPIVAPPIVAPPPGPEPMPVMASAPGTVLMSGAPPTMVEGPPVQVPPGPFEVRPRPPRQRGRWTWLWVSLLVIFLAGLSIDIVRSWQRLNTPKVLPSWAGMTFEAASGQARAMGFVVRRADVSSPVQADQVLSSNPAAGSRLKQGGTVTLNVSAGNQTQVPDVKTKTVDEATAILGGKSLIAKVSDQTVPGSVDGQVAAQDPPAGAVVDRNVTVTLTVTAVPQPTPTPEDNGPNSIVCVLFGCQTPSPTPAPKHKGGGGDQG